MSLDDTTSTPKKKYPSGAQNRKRRAERGFPLTPSERAKRNSDRVRQVRKARQERAEWINSIKLQCGCVDCGYNASPLALEFDHLPGKIKITEVSKMASGGYTHEDILNEIAKCDVVCANCHAIRTHQRRCISHV